MIDITYDPEADAAYVRLGKGTVADTKEAGPFLYDLDDQGRILGLEVLSASKVLAPGEWKTARLPGKLPDAAE